MMTHGSRRTALVLVLLAACVHASAAGASSCTRAVSGYSGFFGAPAKDPADRFVSQLTRWQAGGDMKKLQLFFSFKSGCVLGVKPTYGPAAGNGSALLGLEAGLTGLHLVLQPGERFVEAQHKSGVRCIEYLRLSTNRGRALAIGNALSGTAMATVTVNRAGGYLASLRGWVAPGGGLRQLQLVWGIWNCPVAPAAPAASPKPAAAASPSRKPQAAASPSPKPVTAPSPSPKPQAAASPSPKPAAAASTSPKPVAAASPSPKPPAAAVSPFPKPPAAAASPSPAPLPPSPAPTAAPPAAPVAATMALAKPNLCPNMPAMCSAAAVSGAASCKAVAPFASPTCLGGCCASAGKCKYAGCAANGLGKDAGLVCFGANALPNPLLPGGNKCARLACRLAVPGCTTSLLGGACVGTIVAVNSTSRGGGSGALHAAGAAYLGYPCMESVLTGGVSAVSKFVERGLPALDYVAGGWRACNCSAAAAVAPAPSPAPAPAPSPAPAPAPAPASLLGGLSKLWGGRKAPAGTAAANGTAATATDATGNSTAAAPAAGGELEEGDASLSGSGLLGGAADILLGARPGGGEDAFDDFLLDDGAEGGGGGGDEDVVVLEEPGLESTGVPA